MYYCCTTKQLRPRPPSPNNYPEAKEIHNHGHYSGFRMIRGLGGGGAVTCRETTLSEGVRGLGARLLGLGDHMFAPAGSVKCRV